MSLLLRRSPGALCTARASRQAGPRLSSVCPYRRASSGPKQPAASKAAKPLPYKSKTSKSTPSPAVSPSTASSKSQNAGSTSSSSTSSSPRRSAGPEKITGKELMGTRFIGLFGAGAAALCLGSFTASIVWMYMTPAPTYITGQEPCVPTGRPSACDGHSKALSADEFDAHLDKSEARYGIAALRRELAARAVGHVLEVAVGTGRNLALYDWDRVTAQSRAERTAQLIKKSRYGATRLEDVPELHSFTGVDVAADVLDVALRRIREVVPHGDDLVPAGPLRFAALATPAAGGVGNDGEQQQQQQQQQNAVSLLGGKIRLFQSDAQAALPPAPTAPADPYYDTVVQTFGLCSVRDPGAVLARMAAVARPGTGRIVLVEHGRGWWALVNGLLDRGARGHFERFGCWWNRDLEAVVERAVADQRVPGLEIVELRRPGWFKFGTHYWIELRVRAPGEEEGGQAATPREPAPAAQENSSGGGGDGGGGNQAWSWLTLGSALTTKPKDGSDGNKKE